MTDCIIGQRVGANGYARVPAGKRGVYLYAHRVVWEKAYGPIPAGRHIHHVCGNKACVNIDHLELHTPSDHYAQHRQCDHVDRRVKPNGRTECRECRRQRERQRYATDPAYREYHRNKALKRQRRLREEVMLSGSL